MFSRIKHAIAVAGYPIARYYIKSFPIQAYKPYAWTWIRRKIAWRHRVCRFSTAYGFLVEGDVAEFLHGRLYFFGVWEPAISAFIERRLRDGDCFVDVGANIGYYTLLASGCVGDKGSVVAIEASPRIHSQLLRNLALNRAGNVRTVNVAASAIPGELELFEADEESRGLTTTSPTWAAQSGARPSGRVKALPITDILTEDEIAAARLIKIDVEGAEWDVCKVLLPALERARPELEIVLEVTPSELQAQGRSSRELLAMFAAAGFFPYRIENEYSVDAIFQRKPQVRPQRLTSVNLDRQTDLVFSRVDRPDLE